MFLVFFLYSAFVLFSIIEFLFSFMFSSAYLSHVQFVCVCVRSVLYVIIVCMCALLKIEDHVWTEFAINIDV